MADCGEWGGHTEYINIFKKGKNFYATLNREPLCNPGMDKLEGTPEFCVYIKLNLDYKRIISDFIDNYYREWLKYDYALCCGAIDKYIISFQNRESLFYGYYRDWKGFINLRNTIFRK